MKSKHVTYWSTTLLVAFVLLSGGVACLLQRPENLRGMAELGFPAHMLTILGFWKVLGALALMAPGVPRLKEWAYAGAFFDFSGATFSHAVAGPDPAHLIWPAAFALLALVSWAARPASRTLSVLRNPKPAV